MSLMAKQDLADPIKNNLSIQSTQNEELET